MMSVDWFVTIFIILCARLSEIILSIYFVVHGGVALQEPVASFSLKHVKQVAIVLVGIEDNVG
jgi:hypothetical protein